MNEDDIKEFIEQLKPMIAGSTLELVNVKGAVISLKLVCPDYGIFKVQGKIVKPEDEIKEKILEQFKGPTIQSQPPLFPRII